MSDEKIEDILAGRTVTGKSGFGLYSLIQRIHLTYGIENPVIIQSWCRNGDNCHNQKD